jgi:hypothetical protein
MAITYNQQPSGRLGANSPLIYQVSDAANSGTAGFYYNFDIYVWSGSTTTPATPIATLTKLPDTYASSRAYIDIHRIVTQYISLNAFVFGTLQPTIGTGAYWVLIKTSGYNTASGASPISAIVDSNRILVTRGYSYTIDGIDAAYTNKVYTDRTSILLNTDCTMDYLWYDASVVTSIQIGAATYYPTAGTTSSLSIQGIELREALNLALLWGTNTQITFVAASGNVTIPITFECPNKYGNTTTLFLNKYGVWEGMTWNGVSQANVSVTKENYESALFVGANMTTQWTYGMRQKKNFNINTKKTLNVNTNWIPESAVESMVQFTSSEAILICDGTDYYAANVIDSQVEVKKATNIKLIQYTMQLEYSQPLINKIVR